MEAAVMGKGEDLGKEPPDQPEPALSRKLKAALDLGLQQGGGMGVSAAVIVPGQGLWAGASGMSDPSKSERIKPEMLFYIGSINKSFIAALILELAEEGKLALEDSVDRWLPSYRNIDGSITIRQLLNHTSGIFDYVEHPSSLARVDLNSVHLTKVWTAEEILTSSVSEPYFPPGQDWHYSSTNYVLLAMIANEITQSHISREIRNRFLDPLGLNSTFSDFYEEIPDAFQIAHNWYDLDHDGALEDLMYYPRTAIATWAYGEMYSTAEDLARWTDRLFQGGILQQSSLDQMLTFHYPTPGEDWMEGYGLGIGIRETEGIKSWLHCGSIHGYTSAMLFLPDYRVSMALLENDNNEKSLELIGYTLLRAVLGHLSDKS